MIVKLLTEHHLAFLSFKGGCTGSSESTLVKMSNCWKSHAAAQIIIVGFAVRYRLMRTCQLASTWQITSSPSMRKENCLPLPGWHLKVCIEYCNK